MRSFLKKKKKIKKIKKLSCESYKFNSIFAGKWTKKYMKPIRITLRPS
jgi:hypothetical protein